MGLELSPRNTVTTQKDSYATGTPGVFAAGDMHRGQSLVVWAIAEAGTAPGMWMNFWKATPTCNPIL